MGSSRRLPAAHRALIVADGYYEWQKPEDPKQPKQPFYHRLPDPEPSRSPGCGPPQRPRMLRSGSPQCSIITTAANAEVRVVHDRMPAIFDGPDAEAAWLSADVDLDGAEELVRPFPDGRLEVIRVSPRVNNARDEGVELTEPLHG